MKWILILALILTGCVVTPTPSVPSGTNTSSPTSTAASTPSAFPTPPLPSPPASCQSTDQLNFVYHPSRLVELAPCITVTGTIAVIRTEADGDFHILVALDPQFEHLLTPANQGQELGDLVVEPVCEHTVTQSDAITVCAGDKDPLTPLPVVGEHVSLSGRYVTDSDHGSWAELHPLYSWAPDLALTPEDQ